MKKKFLMGATALVAGLALASCGESEKVELKTMSMFGGTDPHAKTYEKYLDEFATENKISISDNSATSDEIWKTSVISTFYTGDEPDVLFYFTGNVADPLVKNNKVVSVAEIQKEYPEYGKNIKDSVKDDYAVKLKGFVEGLFVNTELFTDDLAPYAAKDSWTWDEFMTISEKLIAKGKTPVALGAQDVPHYWIEHLILGMNGKAAYNAIPSEKDVQDKKENAQNWVKALKLFNTLRDAGVFGEVKGAQKNEDANTSFLSGNSAMILDGSWFAGSITDKTTAKQANVKMMPFPSIPKSMGGQETLYMQSGFTSGFYISRKAWNDPKKKDLAVKLVMKMTSEAAVREFCKTGGGLPADKNVTLENLTNLGTSMGNMADRVTDTTLPLADAAKAGSFAELVAGADSYLSADEDGIYKALEKFAKAQK